MVHKTSGFQDPLVFFLVLWLVVVAQRDSFTLTASYGPGVSCVGYKYFLLSDETDIGCTARIDLTYRPSAIVCVNILQDQTFDFLPAWP